YLKTLSEALASVKANRFEVVAVSAGFDTYRGDLASLNLTEDSYRKIGMLIRTLNKPTFFVLEGGYRGEELGRAIHNLIKGFEENEAQ
ncbi:MAG: histone deacetylase family protein, partial [Thaumarchaeota archaeon]|nr:histone deacetylase family protein [Nitrososphaerota archaeon]